MAELGLWLWGKWSGVLGQPPLGGAQAIIFATLMAVFGHVGDLMESAIKRSVGAKDSGNVLPAFGGLLDLFDSPLFTAPIMTTPSISDTTAGLLGFLASNNSVTRGRPPVPWPPA